MAARAAVKPALVETRCAFCGGVAAQVLGQKHGYRVGKCLTCGLWRTLEHDVDYGVIYQHTAYHDQHQVAEGHEPYKERYDHDWRVARSRYKKLAGLLRSLDVGCANGAFVAFMASKGWAAEGLEVNVGMANWAIKETGCPIHIGWNTVQGPFDLVTYHDVFEHLADPVDELARVRDVLRPHGQLILDVPNAEDPRFAELGLEWHHCRPEQHIYFWDRRHLSGLLADAGFTVTTVDEPIKGKLVIYARNGR